MVCVYDRSGVSVLCVAGQGSAWFVCDRSGVSVVCV